ncbi:AraC family transcriptional regulator [Marinobacterium sediminicola]|uniref:Transcriptional regulator, AraC family n=1 Tax=Marinobacterium sediminicola TaxID=518898 RepID=A0ABY1RXH2_9GAMM|nr:AraC family transcriptional regulator [Marinobacterium sediminicola]ULG67777.1 AraC family transcriptional regulator [Marinobacterium sediminicola]SMR71569.1 transcriptional regulator, AraC family [Marinobacterium sediminicola]
MAQERQSTDTMYLAQSPALPWVEMRAANQSSACYQAHAHDEFSLGVIDAGCASYRNRQQQHHAHRGMLVTINPGDIHSCNPEKGIWSYRMLFIDTRWLGELQSEIYSTQNLDYCPFKSDYMSQDGGYHAFDQLYRKLSDHSLAMAAESDLIEFLYPLFEGHTAIEHERYKCLPELQRMSELILDRLDDNLTLEELGAVSGLSRYQLIRLFRKHYGLPPHAWQLDQRIRRARQLLKQPDSSLSDIAQQLGFADQAHFQRHFRQRTALTPGQFQAFFR